MACVCQECATAIDELVTVTAIQYRDYDSAIENAEFDCKSYSPGVDKDWRCGTARSLATSRKEWIKDFVKPAKDKVAQACRGAL